jgi:DNA helicase-2/ATP-dependent DNA helicase PcrA
MANLDGRYPVDERFRAFMDHNTGLLLCEAGPGTGKTYSFLKRVHSLVHDNRTAPDTICYITFTREIAKAFSADYRDEIGIDPTLAQAPRICTLHSLACRIVRNLGFSRGLDGPLYFASVAKLHDEPSTVFLNDLLPLVHHPDVRTEASLRKHLSDLKQAWRANSDPSSAPDPIPSLVDPCITLSTAYRLVDWDHVIRVALNLLPQAQLSQAWLQHIQHLLVDEYQDFNQSEQALLLSLAAGTSSQVVVGDDDQSLYASRGALPGGLRALASAAPSDQVSLPKCRRCRSSIVAAANEFLVYMRPGAQRLLEHRDGGQVTSHSFKSCKAEIEFLVSFLADAVNSLPPDPRQQDGIAVLFPINKALAYYLDKLEPHVPCYTRNVPTDPVRSRLSLALQLVVRPGQRFVERLLLQWFTDVKPRHKKAIVQLILRHDIPPSTAIDRLVSDGLSPTSASDAAQAFSRLCATLSWQDPTAIAAELSQHLSLDPPISASLVDDLLLDYAGSDPEDAIGAFCDAVLPDTAAAPEQPRAILLVTMHGSKGLTRKTIVMPALERAWLPGTVSGTRLEEQKRLFYVALTRATDSVLMTYPRTRAQGDPLNYNAPGRREPCPYIARAGINEIYHA